MSSSGEAKAAGSSSSQAEQAAIKNLTGCWGLLQEGRVADYVPGMEGICVGSPWAALLRCDDDAVTLQECLFIEQRKVDAKEEFSVGVKLASSHRVHGYVETARLMHSLCWIIVTIVVIAGVRTCGRHT
jgi:hypothetical protein